jgi:hypothetical protein
MNGMAISQNEPRLGATNVQIATTEPVARTGPAKSGASAPKVHVLRACSLLYRRAVNGSKASTARGASLPRPRRRRTRDRLRSTASCSTPSAGLPRRDRRFDHEVEDLPAGQRLGGGDAMRRFGAGTATFRRHRARLPSGHVVRRVGPVGGQPARRCPRCHPCSRPPAAAGGPVVPGRIAGHGIDAGR